MKIIWNLALIAFTVFVSSCANGQAKTSADGLPVDMAPKSFHAAMQATNTVVLDVRTPAEVSAGKIANSMNIDWNGNNFEAMAVKLDKSKTYLVYCAAGGRSSDATDWLLANGFHNVHNLYGGITAWKQQGLPVVK